MARTLAVLPKGARITDYISLGVIASAIPASAVRAVLARTSKAGVRQRALPAPVVVYYVIALALYMHSSYREVLRCLLEGLKWLGGPCAPVAVATDSAISQARTRLGQEPLRELHDELVGPVAEASTRGAWYRGWRLVCLDGSTLDVADRAENEERFGRPRGRRGPGAYPKLRMVSLVEAGTHVLFGSRMGAYRTSENALAREVLPRLEPGMLCLADRGFFGRAQWEQARSTGAELLWRVKAKRILPCRRRLPDGSYLSEFGAAQLRVVEYRLEGVEEAEPLYRVVTTVLDPERAPARELAALYHERWEIETALDELKTHLRGARIVLRSKRPDLVEQEFYGLLLAHFAIRSLMHEAALQADADPDALSFLHAVRVVRRKLPFHAAIPPSGPGETPPGGAAGAS